MELARSSTRLDRGRADVLAAQFVAGLQAVGVRPGDRVAFVAPNSPELVAAIFGCLRAGFAPVVMSASLTSYERTSMLGDVTPALVVDAAVCRSLLAAGEGVLSRPVLGDRFGCRPLHFTSGTSGRPKAVWSGWLDPADADALRAEEDSSWGFRPDDEHWVCSPLSHSAPLRFALYTLAAGGAVHVPARFDVDELRAGLGCGVTTTFMAPAHLQRLLEDGAGVDHRLRLVAHAGAPCPPSVKRAAVEVFGADVVVEFYGSTEGQFTVCRTAEWFSRPGTVGRARAGRKMRVVDGQLWCRPPSHAQFAYWGDPVKTAETWDGEWFTVGDLGRVDDDGYVYLEGRRSDLVITGGVNVYPAEVEAVLREASGVDDLCVVGIDDPRWGQRVCAAVVGTLDPAALQAFAEERLAPFKRPKTVRRVASLPLTHSGKVDRQAVAQLLATDEKPTPARRWPVVADWGPARRRPPAFDGRPEDS